MENPVSDIVVLTDNPQLVDSSPGRILLLEPSYSEINGLLCDGIVLDIKEDEKLRSCLLYLRSHEVMCLLPVYMTRSVDSNIDQLADGVVEHYHEAALLAEPLMARIKQLDYDRNRVLGVPLFRVLLFYYTRKILVTPVKDWRKPSVYTFPLVEVLSGFNDRVDDWLDTQVQRQILDKDSLVDRLRCCPHCGLCNPNYIDVCSNCRSIHISQESFLHCFTCGAVQPEEDFQTYSGSSLVCPQCKENLRHIGTDYDRPLENYTCLKCQSAFSDPLIVAVCQRCESVTETEELEVRVYYSYMLTERGALAARTGQLSEPERLMDDLQNVSYQHFIFQLKWFFAMARRYNTEFFTIFALRIINLAELEAKIGSARIHELMEEYVARVRSSLRVTDFSTRGRRNDLFFMLPKTDEKHCQTVFNRILDFCRDTALDDEGTGLQLKLATLTVPSQIGEHDTPEKIMEFLERELNSAQV